MSLYPIQSPNPAVASDVQQLIDIFSGKHDIGNISLANIIQPPSTTGISLTAQSGGGQGLNVGSYNYQFTLVSGYYKSDGVTFNKTGETPVSSAVGVTTSTGLGNVKVTLPTTGFPVSAYQIGIYRTAVGGTGSYGLIAYVKIGSATYIDQTADASRGAVPPTINTTGTSLTMNGQPVTLVNPVGMATPASGVETTIGFTGGAYWNAGIFTAPITGQYYFAVQFYMNVNNGTGTLVYYKNGVSSYNLDTYTNPTTNTYNYVFHGTLVVGLNANDTVKFTITNTSSSFSINVAHSVASFMKVG